jgi:hypothetical protein
MRKTQFCPPGSLDSVKRGRPRCTALCNPGKAPYSPGPKTQGAQGQETRHLAGALEKGHVKTEQGPRDRTRGKLSEVGAVKEDILAVPNVQSESSRANQLFRAQKAFSHDSDTINGVWPENGTDLPHNIPGLDYSQPFPSSGFRESGAVWHSSFLWGWVYPRLRSC